MEPKTTLKSNQVDVECQVDEISDEIQEIQHMRLVVQMEQRKQQDLERKLFNKERQWHDLEEKLANKEREVPRIILIT